MKKVLIWVLAVLFTLSAAVYQRLTGPTTPLRINTEIVGESVKLKLTRSASVGDGCTVTVPHHRCIAGADLVFRKFPGSFEYDTVKMSSKGEFYAARLPVQPPAGKLEYYVVLYSKTGSVVFQNNENTAVARFKGDVPGGILVPHIIFMFFAMLLSSVAAFMAIFRTGNFRLVSFVAFGSLVLGGLVFGPMVQYYAFGEAWTGWPVGGDLTDNKTLVAALFWLAAVLMNRKEPRRWPIVVAAVVLFAIFSIPHSAWGSELDHESGQIETGKSVSE
ncbi:MAG: hypothetical protein PF489_05380 [Salinivirgaceae bacterium]|jgi:hypothetical protein|nr:hypothetical protein [Salinivirgaceae bacterium]